MTPGRRSSKLDRTTKKYGGVQGGYPRQAPHVRPGHRPAQGTGPVLGAGLRGNLAQRPGRGDGYRLGQHLRLLRQQGSTIPPDHGALRRDCGTATQARAARTATARGAIQAMLRATADGDHPPGHAALLHAHPGRPHRRRGKPRRAGVPGQPAARHARRDQGPARPRRRRRRPHRSAASLDAIARYYTTVVQGMSVQARDGASRADLEAVITCAMAAWDMLASAARAQEEAAS